MKLFSNPPTYWNYLWLMLGIQLIHPFLWTIVRERLNAQRMSWLEVGILFVISEVGAFFWALLFFIFIKPKGTSTNSQGT